MVLISLLLVLSLERAIRKQPVWHVENHLLKFTNLGSLINVLISKLDNFPV